ncbi:MAG: selenocysteine-specific translation elongation factor, partial [Acetobacteraceae bacterium]|nr:selenocysteine-specific translation elongation factor [Acetobacteraceae bacterium]
MIVGTAGHIDHGKTSLVKALTGIDTDRLKEEKQRGITIDLGFAYVPLGGGGALGFVDVPGHERLIHTMIAGAASIDLAMLVIAADDGIMPQTHEHLHILELLGVTRGLVVITKIDAVDAERRAFVASELRALLRGSPFADADIFAVSSLTGEGVDALRERLLAEATDHAPPTPSRALRFAVDRSFVLHGVGVVVTGSVVSGQVALDETIRILPSGL